MTDNVNSRPHSHPTLGDATHAAADVQSAGSEAVHPLVSELQLMLDGPDKATIGELAALIQSISRDLSFFPAAMRDIIEPCQVRAAGSETADHELSRKELEALGELLSAQAQVPGRRF